MFYNGNHLRTKTIIKIITIIIIIIITIITIIILIIIIILLSPTVYSWPAKKTQLL